MLQKRGDSKDRYAGPRDTYRAAGNVVAAASAAPFISINGWAGKVIRIKRIAISCISLTAVAYLRVAVVKRSAATTGGTPVAITGVPLDSSSPTPPAATVNAYTAAPTPGAAVGAIAERRVLGQATTPAAAGYPEAFEFKFGDVEDNEAPVLRAAAETITVDFAAAPATAATLSFEIEWTEDGN